MKEHKGAEAVGCAGFCWGGKMIMQAAALGADAEGGVKAAANAHAAMLSAELAEDVSDAPLREGMKSWERGGGAGNIRGGGAEPGGRDFRS